MPLFETEENIFAYSRTKNGECVLVAANFGPDKKCLRSAVFENRTVLLSNSRTVLEGDMLELLPSQVVVLA